MPRSPPLNVVTPVLRVPPQKPLLFWLVVTLKKGNIDVLFGPKNGRTGFL